MRAYDIAGSEAERMRAGIAAFADLAAAEPDAMSLFVLGAFGAGAKALERRRRTLAAMERSIAHGASALERTADANAGVRRSRHSRPDRQGHRRGRARGDRRASATGSRERAARARRRTHRVGSVLPRDAPDRAPARAPHGRSSEMRRSLASERTRRADGRLPSGRHDLPRELVVKSQRERIVDATAAIVAEKGLAGLTIPEIARAPTSPTRPSTRCIRPSTTPSSARRRSACTRRFSSPSTRSTRTRDDWPTAVAAGLRALIDYLASEPAHARLSIVDTFAASPETIDIRDAALHAFAAYLRPGYACAPKDIDVPAIAAEAIVGGIWQVLHYYIENERIAELPEVTPQLIFMALAPFLGEKKAARVARRPLAMPAR